MGVDFDKLPRHNNTYGYIDIDVGMASSSKRDNVLARYIKEKTGNFINPAQIGGSGTSKYYHLQVCRFLSFEKIRCLSSQDYLSKT